MATNEPAGPRMFSVLFMGLICLILGAVLGVVSLITQPVTELTKAPEEGSMEPGEIYVVKGQRTGGTNWRQKEDALQSGALAQITLSESDLNRWSSSRLKGPKIPGKDDDVAWKEKLQLYPGNVNFNILEDAIQVSVEVEFGGYLKDKTILCTVIGKFDSTPNGVVFVPTSASIGQAPVGVVSEAGEFFLDYVSKRFGEDEGLAWVPIALEELESIEVVDEQLVLKRRV
ncbi:MAG: hypothetical protein AB3N63_08810 [Puniceicoccaceae bacterium]